MVGAGLTSACMHRIAMSLLVVVAISGVPLLGFLSLRLVGRRFILTRHSLEAAEALINIPSSVGKIHHSESGGTSMRSALANNRGITLVVALMIMMLVLSITAASLFISGI